MFGDTIIYDAGRRVTLNLKRGSGIYSNTQDVMSSLVICKYYKDLNKTCRGNLNTCNYNMFAALNLRRK